MEARRAVYSIAIEQCHRWHSQVRAHRISSSGIEAPSRKLNAEREWSSTCIGCQLSASSCQLFDWELTTGNCFQSYIPSTNQFHLSCPVTKRYTRVRFLRGWQCPTPPRPAFLFRPVAGRARGRVQTISPAMSSRSRHRIRTGSLRAK